MMDPTDYLARSASAEVAPGWPVCAFWTAAWCEECSGVNPGAPMRGRYKTALGCNRLVKREGGLATLAAKLMRISGFPSVTQAEPGTIGLIDTPDAGPTLGIMAVTGKWVCKGVPNGLVFPTGDVLMMWSPECRR